MGVFTYTDNILYTDIPNLNTDTFCLSFPIQDMQRYNCNRVENVYLWRGVVSIQLEYVWIAAYS
jgi:hypothetical protein